MRQSRKKLRARALRDVRSFMVPPHLLRSKDGAETRAMLHWLSGYAAARRDIAKANRRPVGLNLDIIGGPGPIEAPASGKALLVIPALGSRPQSRIECLACGWPCNSVGTCSNLGCPGLGGGDA
jgi:hypothetical protein